MTDDIIRDDRGNTASIAYFGSVEAAQKALDSNTDCDNCHNCYGCSDCSRCSGCSDCSYVDSKTGVADKDGPPPVPVIPDIHAAIYSAASSPGALDMGRWHCGTTHCRAGWAVALAGDAGYALEAFYNTELAAMMIYNASDPGFQINPARFYDTSEKALADMKALADAREVNRD